MIYSRIFGHLSRSSQSCARGLLAVPAISLMIVVCLIDHNYAQDLLDSPDARSREGTLDRWQGNSWLGGQQSAEWNLGVRGDSTETGFLISQVTPGSAADRARLRVRDIIITVEGFQVGQVSGRLYDLTQEINRRADSKGAVRLLLQDGQSGRLASVSVQLDRHSHQLTGMLLAPQTLPADAVVTVQIDNVTRPYMVVRNGQQVLSGANQRNIPFRISYDPAYLAASDVYQVRATVASGGRDILYSQPSRVLTQGNPSNVQLRLEGFTNTTGTTSTVVTAGYVNYNELDQRLIAIYREYLGREPTAAELAAARVLGTSVSNTLERLPLKLMASQEYFDLARNDNDFWLSNVFGVIIGRPPKPDELARWRQRFVELRYSRTELLRQLKQASL